MLQQVNNTEISIIQPPMVSGIKSRDHDYGDTEGRIDRCYCRNGCCCWVIEILNESGGPDGVDPHGDCPGSSSLPPQGGSSLN
jgi:hypothetical protein